MNERKRIEVLVLMRMLANHLSYKFEGNSFPTSVQNVTKQMAQSLDLAVCQESISYHVAGNETLFDETNGYDYDLLLKVSNASKITIQKYYAAKIEHCERLAVYLFGHSDYYTFPVVNADNNAMLALLHLYQAYCEVVDASKETEVYLSSFFYRYTDLINQFADLYFTYNQRRTDAITYSFSGIIYEAYFQGKHQIENYSNSNPVVLPRMLINYFKTTNLWRDAPSYSLVEHNDN